MSDLMMPTGNRRDLTDLHPEMPEQIDRWLEARSKSWRQLMAGELGLPVPPGFGGLTQLQVLQWWLIQSDPVLFAETMMVERPENGGCRWRLWDYQKPSLRYRGHVCNASSSAVGKTRELEIEILQGCLCQPGSILVVSSQDGMVEAILRDIEYQAEQNAWLGSQIRGIVRRPRRVITAANGNEVTLLPTGTDGEPLRGQHPSQKLLGDECDKWWNPEIWNEFWRAPEPRCVVRLYSVLSGRRGTVFSRIREKAIPLEQIESGETRVETRRERAKGQALGENYQWALICWQMTQRPDWSEARRQEMIERYGGEHTSGYQRNVLGLPGEPEEAVFNRGDLRACRRSRLDYTRIVVAVDRARGTAIARVHRSDPSYVEGGDSPLLQVRSLETELGQFDLAGFLDAHLHLPPGTYGLGVDFGQSPDPTEVAIVRAEGARLALVARISLRGIAYHEQGWVLGKTVHERVRPALGWGVDGTGVGSAVEQHIREHLENPHDLSSYQWNRSVPLIDPRTLEPLADEQGRERTVSTKEMATQVLENLLATFDLELPHDPEVTEQLENHNATLSPSGARRFDKKDDHIVDALRGAALRRFDLEHGLALSPPPLESVFTLDRGSRTVRESRSALEGFARGAQSLRGGAEGAASLRSGRLGAGGLR